MIEVMRIESWKMHELAAVTLSKVSGTLIITPFFKENTGKILNVLKKNTLGLSVSKESDQIISVKTPYVDFKMVLKRTKEFAEQTRIALRNIRRDALKGVEDRKEKQVVENAIQVALKKVDSLVFEKTGKGD